MLTAILPYINAAAGFVNTFGLVILSMLHIKNASQIATTVGNAAVAASSDAAAIAHGQWAQALPDIISQVQNVVATVAPGNLGSINTPSGNALVHVGNDAKVTVLGMTESPLGSGNTASTGHAHATSQGPSSVGSLAASVSNLARPPLVKPLRQVTG
jgi:hypothetical protein